MPVGRAAVIDRRGTPAGGIVERRVAGLVEAPQREQSGIGRGPVGRRRRVRSLRELRDRSRHLPHADRRDEAPEADVPRGVGDRAPEHEHRRVEFGKPAVPAVCDLLAVHDQSGKIAADDDRQVDRLADRHGGAGVQAQRARRSLPNRQHEHDRPRLLDRELVPEAAVAAAAVDQHRGAAGPGQPELERVLPPPARTERARLVEQQPVRTLEPPPRLAP